MSAATPRAPAPRLPRSERREQILDAALALMSRDGYAGFSMEAAARQAGVTKPVVYAFFGNRGELLQALLVREERRALREIARAVPARPWDGEPRELILSGLEIFLRSVSADPDPWRLILRSAEGVPELVADHIARGRRTVAAQLRDLVAWALERRGGAEGFDDELAARAILTLAQDAARLLLADPERFTPERLVAFAGVLLDGLVPHRS